jgi:RNA polymerase sigma factor (sigma-70 family)
MSRRGDRTSWPYLLDVLDPDPPAGAEHAEPDVETRRRAMQLAYARLMRYAGAVVRKLAPPGSLGLDPEELASQMIIRMFHPRHRVQDALIDRVRRSESPAAYLTTAIRNLAKEEIRTRRRRSRLSVAAAKRREATAPGPAPPPHEVDEAAWLMRDALQRLRPSDRALVRARLGGRSTAEIAAEEGVPTSVMAVRVSRAVGRLREAALRLAAEHGYSPAEFANALTPNIDAIIMGPGKKGEFA